MNRHFLSFNKTHSSLIILVITALLFSSCSMFRAPRGDSKYAASFQSYPNGVADIHLELKENMRFEYSMKIFPQPENEAGDTLPELLTYKGRWGNDKENYILRFRRRNKPDLYALVSPGYQPETKVRVKNERVLLFPLKDDEVVLWGIRCFRE